jgi:hypothetical protein
VKIKVEVQGEDQGVGRSACMVRIYPEADGRRSIGRSRCKRFRQVEFPATIEADSVRTMLDREHAAEVTVPATKYKLKDTQEQFHKSCARWRRSELPLMSSHSSKDRTLARARAIAQSAAP